MMEFDGTGDRVMFPFRSRQQIAAKLLDMFGDGEAKVIARAADVQVKPVKERSGPKMYIYHDGTGEATLQLAPTWTTDCSSSSGSTIGSRALAISAFQGKTKDEVKQPPPARKTIRSSESTVNAVKGYVAAPVGGVRSTSGSFLSSFDTAAAATPRAEGAPKVPDTCSLKAEPNEGEKMSKGPEFCSFEIEGPTSLTGVSVRPAWTSSPKGGCGSTFSTPAWLTPGGEPSAAITETGNTSSTSETVPNFPPSVPLEERESLGLAFGASLTAEDWLLGTSLMLDVGSIF
eukprot:jgi/Undpi1/5169/HiC_scaffold_19.g08520.m1